MLVAHGAKTLVAGALIRKRKRDHRQDNGDGILLHNHLEGYRLNNEPTSLLYCNEDTAQGLIIFFALYLGHCSYVPPI